MTNYYNSETTAQISEIYSRLNVAKRIVWDKGSIILSLKDHSELEKWLKESYTIPSDVAEYLPNLEELQKKVSKGLKNVTISLTGW